MRLTTTTKRKKNLRMGVLIFDEKHTKIDRIAHCVPTKSEKRKNNIQKIEYLIFIYFIFKNKKKKGIGHALGEKEKMRTWFERLLMIDIPGVEEEEQEQLMHMKDKTEKGLKEADPLRDYLT